MINGSESWQETVSRKRQIRDNLIEQFLEQDQSDVKADTVTQITDIADLRNGILQGDLTASQVVRAYISKAIAAHQKTNCLTEICFAEASQQAQILDKHFEDTKELIGPLHGVPMTVKDQFNITNFDATLGYVGRCDKPATEDAAIIQILSRLGAIVIAKSNLPQSIMWAETDNPLWGLTTNSRDSNLSPGGSSGGEGALLACNGSILGWGTDIGGSIRIPAATNGVYGLKPSSGRLPYLGVPVSTEGQEHVHSVIGPMTRSLSTMTEVTKLVIDNEPWKLDPRCHPIPWRQEAYDEVLNRPLVFGIVHHDGIVQPHPPIRRALMELEDKLKTAGHEVVKWDTSGHQELIDIMDAYYSADGCEDLRRDLSIANEPIIPRVQALLEAGDAISVYEYWQLNKRKLAAQVAYNKKWEMSVSPRLKRKVDVLITPVMPHNAIAHNRTRWIGYTKVYNILDYSALVFPANVASRELDPVDKDYQPLNEIDKWEWESYDAEVGHGHPTCLQIIGRRLEEEKVLGVAKVIENLLR